MVSRRAGHQRARRLPAHADRQDTAAPYEYDSEKIGRSLMRPAVTQTKMFFPIDDGSTFATAVRRIRATPHNYSFTVELHTSFIYNGGEFFHFRGDDDVFVYINGKLVINLGGIHGPETADVNVDTLGLTKESEYTLDFFSAERHKGGSNLLLTTSLGLVPAMIKLIFVALPSERESHAALASRASITDRRRHHRRDRWEGARERKLDLVDREIPVGMSVIHTALNHVLDRGAPPAFAPPDGYLPPAASENFTEYCAQLVVMGTVLNGWLKQPLSFTQSPPPVTAFCSLVSGKTKLRLTLLVAALPLAQNVTPSNALMSMQKILATVSIDS